MSMNIIQSIHRGHLQKPEQRGAGHIRRKWKTIYIVPHTNPQGKVALCPQTSTCPSIQVVATSSTLPAEAETAGSSVQDWN